MCTLSISWILKHLSEASGYLQIEAFSKSCQNVRGCYSISLQLLLFQGSHAALAIVLKYNFRLKTFCLFLSLNNQLIKKSNPFIGRNFSHFPSLFDDFTHFFGFFGENESIYLTTLMRTPGTLEGKEKKVSIILSLGIFWYCDDYFSFWDVSISDLRSFSLFLVFAHFKLTTVKLIGDENTKTCF